MVVFAMIDVSSGAGDPRVALQHHKLSAQLKRNSKESREHRRRRFQRLGGDHRRIDNDGW